MASLTTKNFKQAGNSKKLTWELLGSPRLCRLQNPPDVIGLVHGDFEQIAFQHERLQGLHRLGRKADLRGRVIHLLCSLFLLLKTFLFTRVLAVVAGPIAEVRVFVFVVSAGF